MLWGFGATVTSGRNTSPAGLCFGCRCGFVVRRRSSCEAKVNAVATDIEAVTTLLPKASLVFDRLQLIKHFNDRLSRCRRELYREATNQLHKNVVNGNRWLLLRRSTNLDPKQNEPAPGSLQFASRNNWLKPGCKRTNLRPVFFCSSGSLKPSASAHVLAVIWQTNPLPTFPGGFQGFCNVQTTR
jgi:hypothetical protein